MRTLIRNGRVVLDGALRNQDLLLEEGRVAALGAFSPAPGDRVLEACGCYVLPGLVDFHTHVGDRIGPWELADSYEAGTRVALENGITTLCTFVTQGPSQPLLEAMAAARERAGKGIHCDVLWHLTPTTFAAEDLALLKRLIPAGYRTIKLYTTYRKAGIYASRERIETLFRELAPSGAQFLVHCEDDDLIAAVDTRDLDLGRAATHGRLRPEAAEVEAIRQVAALALRHGTSLHVVHVSTLEGARHLLECKALGDFSFETCPQYLFLDDSWLERPDGHRWICSPPLRGDRAPFMDLIRQGAADILATDHCPYCARDKDAWDGTDVREVPNGLPGLGALPHLAWRLWGEDPDRAALALALHLSANPARRAGLSGRKGALRPGMDGDVVVLDPAGPSRPLRSTPSDAPECYPGFTSPLAIRHVVLAGEPRVADGHLLQPQRPSGRCLQPPPFPPDLP